MPSSMSSLMPRVELGKVFYQAPEQWLAEQGIGSLAAQIAPDLLKRQQALDEKKVYKAKTGKLSREIGALKQAGQSAEELIAEMKVYKTELTAIDDIITKTEESVSQCVMEQLVILAEKNTEAESPPNTQNNQLDYSALTIEPLNDALRPACLHYLKHSTEASLYHHPDWCDLIKQSFGHESHYYTAHISGEVIGVLPVVNLTSRLFGNFGISMPYFNYGGPIGKTEEVVLALLDAAKQQAIASQLSHIEYRCLKPLNQYPGHQNKLSMWLDLPESSELLWKALGTKVRAQVNKAKPYGFTVHIGGEELLDDFYRVFAINMRDLGTPVYAKSFFKNILESNIGKNNIVVLKNDKGEAVSASFLMGHKHQLEVPWASTLKKYNHSNANMFLYWHMLKFACDKGYKVFDFGRSSINASTFKFKKQWGAKPMQLYWYYWLADGGELPQLNPNNPKYKLVIKAWQKLPVWLTKIIGPFIVKNLP